MPFSEEFVTSGGSRIGLWRIDGTEMEQASDRLELLDFRVKHPRTQLQRVASRLLLEKMLGTWPDVRKDEYGKPFLFGQTLQVSISHTGGYAAAMLGNQQLGVDVQELKPNVMKVRDRFLDDRELEMAQNIETTTLFWAAKEAIYKYNAKPGLDFRDPITVHSIESEILPSSFIYEDVETNLNLGWKKLENAMLVWTP